MNANKVYTYDLANERTAVGNLTGTLQLNAFDGDGARIYFIDGAGQREQTWFAAAVANELVYS